MQASWNRAGLHEKLNYKADHSPHIQTDQSLNVKTTCLSLVKTKPICNLSRKLSRAMIDHNKAPTFSRCLKTIQTQCRSPSRFWGHSIPSLNMNTWCRFFCYLFQDFPGNRNVLATGTYLDVGSGRMGHLTLIFLISERNSKCPKKSLNKHIKRFVWVNGL